MIGFTLSLNGVKCQKVLFRLADDSGELETREETGSTKENFRCGKVIVKGLVSR